MKLSTNDLDKSLIDKITQLDEMRLNYTKDDGNIVMYDGNSFYTGKIPEVKVKLPYFSTEVLYNFKQNLFSNNELYTSSYTNNFQNEVRNNSAFKNIMKSMSYSFISKLDSTALFFKMYGSYYYAFTSSGKLYKISKTVDMEKFSDSSESGESRKWKLILLENRAKNKIHYSK